MITAVHQQTASCHLPPQILTYLGEAGSRSRPDRQEFHVSCTAAPAELRQAGRTGSTELAILRGFATSNCPSARQRIVGREDCNELITDCSSQSVVVTSAGSPVPGVPGGGLVEDRARPRQRASQ
jgi:hypothetical protein